MLKRWIAIVGVPAAAIVGVAAPAGADPIVDNPRSCASNPSAFGFDACTSSYVSTTPTDDDDWDNDGVKNNQDPDDDNDGIPDNQDPDHGRAYPAHATVEAGHRSILWAHAWTTGDGAFLDSPTGVVGVCWGAANPAGGTGGCANGQNCPVHVDKNGVACTPR